MSTLTFTPIENVGQVHTLNNEQMLAPNKQPDKSILYAMDEDTYEELVASWAYSCLKGRYVECYRIGGAGDHGIDILACRSESKDDCDIYQCKHYNAPVTASTILPEICKILYFAFIGTIPVPKKYFVLAPKGLNANFMDLYIKPDKLKAKVLETWDNYADHITQKKKILLSDELRTFIDGIDFSKFSCVSPDKFLEDLRDNKHLYHQYFGVRLSDIVRVKMDVPKEVEQSESTYVSHLLDAYSESGEIDGLQSVANSRFSDHFTRARKTFWIAESLRKISEDNSPGETDEFADFMEDMELHVADVYEEDYSSGLERNKDVIAEAKKYIPKASYIISGQIGAGEKIGVCYHLSNNNKLIWVKSKS